MIAIPLHRNLEGGPPKYVYSLEFLYKIKTYLSHKYLYTAQGGSQTNKLLPQDWLYVVASTIKKRNKTWTSHK